MTRPVLSTSDTRHLDRAFDLAERARGRVSPNPFVGCVITDPTGDVVGEGWTQPPGSAHAEAMALAIAGSRANGGTAYVTLEPCDHTGRTPPCSGALVDAGIARVIVALADPDPTAAGGADTLSRAGVDVIGGAAEDRARRQNEVFLLNVSAQRPFVVWKAAMSLDGQTADVHGRSQWITGPSARAAGHLLRAEVDAVLVGSQTALADDPTLTVRLEGYDGPQPLRVVLDRRGRTELADLQMFSDGLAPTMVCDAPDPVAVLERLWHRGVRSVLLEGGAVVAAAFASAGLIDRYVLHYGNVLLGGGTPALAITASLADAPRLRLVSADVNGDDVVVVAYPRKD